MFEDLKRGFPCFSLDYNKIQFSHFETTVAEARVEESLISSTSTKADPLNLSPVDQFCSTAYTKIYQNLHVSLIYYKLEMMMIP